MSVAFQKAMSHWERGEVKQAIPHFQKALAEAPDNLNVIYRTILTLITLRDYAGCAKWLGELLPHVDGSRTEAWLMCGLHYNYGVALEATGLWEEARNEYVAALRYDPLSVMPRVNLGGIYYRLGLPDIGHEHHSAVLGRTDLDAESRPSVAFIHMLRGNYVAGFREYDGRWKLPQILSQSYVPKNAKRWYGQHLEYGKKLLVVAEQGFGDVLMMARYIPRLCDMGLRPVLVVHAGLVRLMAHSFPHLEVTALEDKKHSQAGYWVPMMSLPRCFETTLDTIPDAVCITPPSDGIDLGATDRRLRVGYVQRGNHLHMGDKDRSCHDDAAWSRLLDVPGIEWVNLDEKALRERWGVRDMADTASIVAQCDLIVSIDSAVAHLAGAMGKPAWLLPPCGLEWRWGMLDRPGNDWYKTTHKLYRRKHVADWPDVIERVRNDLEAL